MSRVCRRHLFGLTRYKGVKTCRAFTPLPSSGTLLAVVNLKRHPWLSESCIGPLTCSLNLLTCAPVSPGFRLNCYRYDDWV